MTPPDEVETQGTRVLSDVREIEYGKNKYHKRAGSASHLNHYRSSGNEAFSGKNIPSSSQILYVLAEVLGASY